MIAGFFYMRLLENKHISLMRRRFGIFPLQGYFHLDFFFSMNSGTLLCFDWISNVTAYVRTEAECVILVTNLTPVKISTRLRKLNVEIEDADVN